MSRESLRDLLARVHERLSHAGSIDPESRRLLVTVMDDIHRALGETARDDAGGRAGETTAPRAAPHGAGPRLEALAVQFEAEHPTLAQGLRQLIDALGKAGI